MRDYGYQVGLVSEDTYKLYQVKKKTLEDIIDKAENTRVMPTKVSNDYLVSRGSAPIFEAVSIADLLKRPEIGITDVTYFLQEEHDEDIP